MDPQIDWSQHFDGGIWLFKRGEDFDASPERFRRRARAVAQRYRRSIRTERDGEDVAVRFGPPKPLSPSSPQPK